MPLTRPSVMYILSLQPQGSSHLAAAAQDGTEIYFCADRHSADEYFIRSAYRNALKVQIAYTDEDDIQTALMAYKRPRTTFEADLHSSYVSYGTPLPPLDPDTRDDGSYVPVWKQEVTDEQGRKRLHGAFTGGFSAGYFNTVGSKEGWTPSQFISSRKNRKNATPTIIQKPEDFMDDEDMAEAEESRKLQTMESFAALGSTAEDRSQKELLLDGLKTTGDTMGMKLLRKMGWRDGQGIGPKIRRKARLDEEDVLGGDENQETHLFAPENSQMISFERKNDRKGLGLNGEAVEKDTVGLIEMKPERETDMGTKNNKLKKSIGPRSGLGVGILNDTGSDDEDPYHIGPQISYNRVIGGDKKKKKKPENLRTVANPLLSTKPFFISKRVSPSKARSTFRRCHDGRLPLDGFVLSQISDSLSTQTGECKYTAPVIPPNWKSSKMSANPNKSNGRPTSYQSAATAAQLSALEPKTRASILGEAQLPGKSVFDYLSPSARSRIASAAQNPALPPALNEAHTLQPSQTRKPHDLIPPLSPRTAQTALQRGSAGWNPYADDAAKLSRYSIFLEACAGLLPPEFIPPRAPGASTDDWVKEMQEFAHAAQIFRPVSGLMATRFATSSSAPKVASDPPTQDYELLTHPAEKKEQDPAMQAAAVGMYGPLTRSMVPFYPTRLLCKRFNVKPPDHIAPDPASTTNKAQFQSQSYPTSSSQQQPSHSTTLPQRRLELVGKKDMDEILRESGRIGNKILGGAAARANDDEMMDNSMTWPAAATIVDPERNEALEVERPGDAVFKAIFGGDNESEGEG